MLENSKIEDEKTDIMNFILFNYIKICIKWLISNKIQLNKILNRSLLLNLNSIWSSWIGFWGMGLGVNKVSPKLWK